MNLLHLQYFYVVAKENGFTKASKLLRIQQPAISRMVRLLEEQLGFKLFEKIGRNVRLTTQGQEVFAYAKRIFAAVEELEHAVGSIGGELKGALLLAASEPIGSHFLPLAIRELREKYPKIYSNIFTGPAAMLFDKIYNGELEFGIFLHIPELPDKLEIFAKIDVRHHLVIRRDLKRKKEVIETYIGSREIDDTRTRRFPTLERLHKDFPKAAIKISSNNLTAHRQMVLQGMGISILPDFLIKEDLKAGVLVDIYPHENFTFQMKFIKRKTAVLSANAVALVKICKQFC